MGNSRKAAEVGGEVLTFVAKPFDALSTRELYEVLKARSAVFIMEESIRYQDMDDADYRSWHVFYQDGAGLVQAYMRIYPKADEPGIIQMGRVLTRTHGTGLGGRLLRGGIEVAHTEMGAKGIYLESQQHAEGYYLKEGFRTCSEPFLEEGIVHVQMRLEL